MNLKKSLLGLTLAAGLCFAGTANAADLYVSGAASLTNAFEAVKAAFVKKNPGVNVLTNYAASNPLLKQMQEGAPVDVFASADQATMDKAQKDNLIDPATRKNFALNDLVLIVPSDSKLKIKDVKSLDSAKVKRIAIGNPDSVPAGRYTRDALTNAKLWEKLAPKYINSANVGGHEPVSYPIAVAKTGKNAADGAKFVDFVLSEEGQKILAGFGFSKP